MSSFLIGAALIAGEQGYQSAPLRPEEGKKSFIDPRGRVEVRKKKRKSFLVLGFRSMRTAGADR